MKLTRHEVRSAVRYEPSTGWLINRIDRAGNAKRGAINHCVDSKGYLCIRINGRLRRTHRMVWFMHFGWLPKEVDHINRNRLDNRIENLRPANRRQNNLNASGQRNSSSQYKGVCFDKERSMWMAKTKLNGRSLFIGRYSTEREAANAYQKFMVELHGGGYFAP